MQFPHQHFVVLWTGHQHYTSEIESTPSNCDVKWQMIVSRPSRKREGRKRREGKRREGRKGRAGRGRKGKEGKA